MSVKRHKELTGRHVLSMVLAFLGLIIAVNGYFLFTSVTSFRGEDVKGSYRQGLEYNQTIATRESQKALRWTVAANFIENDTNAGEVIVEFRGAMNEPIEGLSIKGILHHPANLSEDHTVVFEPRGAGRYVAQTGTISGSRQLRALAQRDDETFRFQFDLK